MRKKPGDKVQNGKMVRKIRQSPCGSGYLFEDIRDITLRLGCRFQGVTSSEVREILSVGERRARQIVQTLEEAGDLIRTPNVRDQHRGRPPVIYRTNPDLFAEFA